MYRSKSLFSFDVLSYSMIINALCKIFSMLFSFLYIPLVISVLGDEKYGVWVVFLNIISWIAAFDAGVGSGLRNKLTESLSLAEKKKCRELVSSAYAIISIIISFALVIAIIISALIDWNKLLNTSQSFEHLNLVVIICLICFSINLILSLCNSVLYALQLSHMVSVIGVITQALNYFAVCILAKYEIDDLLIISLIYGGITLFVGFSASVILYYNRSDLRPSLKCISFETGKSITSIGFGFFFIQISALILFSTDNLIVSNLFGAEKVTPYSLVNKVYTTVILFHSALITPFWSASTNAKTLKNFYELKKMIKFLFLFLLPFVIFSIIVSFFFRDLVKLWIGENINFSVDIIICGCIYCIIYLWCNTIGIIASGLGIVKSFSIVAIIQAVVNIPLSLFFAIVMGLETTGVLIGTILAMVISAVTIPIVVFKDINKMERNDIINS